MTTTARRSSWTGRSHPRESPRSATAIMAKTTERKRRPFCATNPSNLFWRQSAAKLLGSRPSKLPPSFSPSSSSGLSPSRSSSFARGIARREHRSSSAILASLPRRHRRLLVYVASRETDGPCLSRGITEEATVCQGDYTRPFLAAEKY